jgi:hypothetical protein
MGSGPSVLSVVAGVGISDRKYASAAALGCATGVVTVVGCGPRVIVDKPTYGEPPHAAVTTATAAAATQIVGRISDSVRGNYLPER